MASVAREPRAYEFMTILIPELADEDLNSQIERLIGYFTSVGGTVKDALTDSPWGRRRLAYTVRFSGTDYRDGIYVLFHVDLEPSRVAEVERELKFDVRVMRYLVVHDDPKAGEKSIPGQELPESESEDAGAALTATASVAATDATANDASAAPESVAEPVSADEPAPADEPVDESASADVPASEPASVDEPAASAESTTVDEPAAANSDLAAAEPVEEPAPATDTPTAEDNTPTDDAPAEDTKES